MYRLLITILFLLTFGLAGQTFAGQDKMEAIDEALEDEEIVNELSASELEKVKFLRHEGEEHYRAMDRDLAHQAFDEAKEVLGIN